jgi:hypothetical protein
MKNEEGGVHEWEGLGKWGNPPLERGLHFLQAGQGLIGELFHPHDSGLNERPSDGEGQERSLSQRGSAKHLDSHTACRKAWDRGLVGSTLQGKGKIDFFPDPGFLPLIRTMLSAEDGPALGARDEGTGVGNENVGTAFGAGNSEHNIVSGRRVDCLRGNFILFINWWSRKSLFKRHPGESRGPEDLEMTGFRLPPEWRILRIFDFLQDHYFFIIQSIPANFKRSRLRSFPADLPWVQNDFFPFRKKLGIKEKTASIHFPRPNPVEFYNHQESLVDQPMPGSWNESC